MKPLPTWGSDQVADATRSAMSSGILGIVGTAIFSLSVWHPSPRLLLQDLSNLLHPQSL